MDFHAFDDSYCLHGKKRTRANAKQYLMDTNASLRKCISCFKTRLNCFWQFTLLIGCYCNRQICFMLQSVLFFNKSTVWWFCGKQKKRQGFCHDLYYDFVFVFLAFVTQISEAIQLSSPCLQRLCPFFWILATIR